jgi:hypothetical protein
MFDRVLEGLMAAGSFPCSIQTTKRTVSQLAMAKSLRPSNPQTYCKSPANRVAVRGQHHLPIALVAFVSYQHSLRVYNREQYRWTLFPKRPMLASALVFLPLPDREPDV